MAEWIRWTRGFARKPEVVRVAAALGISRYHAAALIMEKVFEWTDENVSAKHIDADGNATVYIGPSPAQLFDAQSEVSGLADALSAAGWLYVRGSSLVFPNFHRHNGSSAKTRALTASRVSKHRERAVSELDSVTEDALPEERRGDKTNSKEKKEGGAIGFVVEWSPETGWTGITQADRDGWAKAYPACDLDRQLAGMTEWLKSNPEKAHKTRWRRFITNWLTRSQNNGGDLRGYPTKRGQAQAATSRHDDADDFAASVVQRAQQRMERNK